MTLAGFRLLDPNGIVIAGREEVGLSLAHLEEVAEALQGHFSGALRVRISKHDQPSLYSMSRGTGMRVFTAMPVIVRGQVAGVIYASRTPSNVFKYLYEQRGKVALAILCMIVPTLLIGFLFHRTITEPMRELVERTNLIGKGDRDALRPLKRHGTSEFARLSQSFLDMARRLNTRSSFISTFATHVSHELKSPLTSIQGAAELLRDDVDCTRHGRRGPAQVSRQHHRRHRPAGEDLRPLARFRPRRKPGCARRRQTVGRDRRPAFGVPCARYSRQRRTRYADAHLRGERRYHLFQSRRQCHAP